MAAAIQHYRISFPITIEPEPPAEDPWTWFDVLVVIVGGITIALGVRWYLT